MNLLTDDMSAAIDSTDLTVADRKLIENILYQERQNKALSWDADAEKYVMKLIDEDAAEVNAQ